MSHLLDATLSTAVANEGDPNHTQHASLPAPTILQGPASGDDTLTYGLVARVALA